MCDLLWFTNVSQSHKAERGAEASSVYHLHAHQQQLFTVLPHQNAIGS